jgi:hypothetical protein
VTTTPVTPVTPVGAARRVDAVLTAAVDLSRDAALQEAEGNVVGEHLGTHSPAERVVTHVFACTDPAYVGWVWEVQLSRAPRQRSATVDDVLLLPGQGAILAPDWVPWHERVLPGDVGVGDVLPTAADDPRLVLRSEAVREEDDPDLWLELGLGRPRAMSATGRAAAAQRWFDGDHGPEAPLSTGAPKAARCATCGFSVRLAGGLGRVFSVCANGLAPDDGRVVSADHGCGAHSQAAVVPPSGPVAVTEPEPEHGLAADAPVEPHGHG